MIGCLAVWLSGCHQLAVWLSGAQAGAGGGFPGGVVVPACPGSAQGGFGDVGIDNLWFRI